MRVHRLTFNPFEENTYLLADDTGQCAIVDPGCMDAAEQQQLAAALQQLGWTPAWVVNTHAHIDHIFGVRHCMQQWQLPFYLHPDEQQVLDFQPQVAQMYALPLNPPPPPTHWLKAGEPLNLGGLQLQVLHTPGHSPGSVSLYHAASKQLIVGDVLFRGSIGRTDLPGGHHATLINSITDRLLPLGDDVTAYPGHGPTTTLGEERRGNPFLVGPMA